MGHVDSLMEKVKVMGQNWLCRMGIAKHLADARMITAHQRQSPLVRRS